MSQLADTVEELIHKALPNYQIYREHCVSISNRKLFFEFCIPILKVMVEVQGSQHSKFVGFFHGLVDNFNKSVARDNLKQEWCELHGYSLIYFDYREVPKLTEDDVKRRIVDS